MEISTKLDLQALGPGASKDLEALSREPKRGIFIEMSGSFAGRVHRLTDAEVTVGRSADCTIHFDDNTLSRTHARVRGGNGCDVLEDCTSLNGTYVNQTRITEVVLTHGDRVQFGSGIRLQYQRVTLEEERILIRLYEAAVLDGLTGLTNRRALQERLESELAYALRHSTPLAVLLLDIDFFKRVNDTYGHLAGDDVLRSVAQLFQKEVRCEDLAARYGGEEFVVVTRGINLEGACCLAERLRKAVEARTILHGDESLQVTVSIGVASLEHGPTEPSVAQLLEAADRALYRAKEGGRNQVVAAQPLGLND
jgi:two-component system cell cycle response regulator